MTRPALNIAPSYGEVDEFSDAYLHPLQLRPLAKKYGRFWSFHDIPTTVALPGNRYAKSLKGFTHHLDEPSFRELLREYSEHGVPRPTGYADVFHSRYHATRVPWSINAQLAPAFAGGWQQAFNVGSFRGTFYKYDMRSAYLWAATLGIPDSDTYSRSVSPVKSKFDGVYRVELLEGNQRAPFPYQNPGQFLVTNQEIEMYDLRIGRIIDGVVWKRLLSPDKLMNAIKAVSTWKLAARSYWGRWAQMQRVECASPVGKDEEGKWILKRWTIPNIALNVPLAHVIVSRVRMRLWEYSTNALHVFVDSVITPEKIKTGDSLGDWRLEKTYPNGVIIRNAGQYGDIDSPRMEKMAGIPSDSDLRKLA